MPLTAPIPEPDLPNSSCPSMLNSSSNTEETDSNIDRQDVQDRGTVPSSTTEQPNNPTTVLPPEPVTAAIPDTAIVPEEAIKAPEAASEPDPVVAEEPEAEVESNEKSQV